MKKLLLILSLILLLSSCVKTANVADAANNSAEVQPELEAKKDSSGEDIINMITIEYNVLTDDEEIAGTDKKVLYQDVRYPSIKMDPEFKETETGKRLSPNIELLNKKMNNDAIDFLNNNKDEVRQTFKERGDDGGNYAHSEDLYIERCDDRVLSITSNCYEDLMGAHGSTTITGYNYDVKTGKEIKFATLIKDKSKMKDVIVDYLMKQDYKDDLFDEYQDTINDLLNGKYPICYIITLEGITITFNQYDIAPYAIGAISVPVSYANNADLFSVDYWS